MPILVLATAFTQAGSSARGAQPLRVGMVLLAPTAPAGYPNYPVVGLMRAVKRLGIHGLAVNPPVREGFGPSLTAFALSGYRLVFASGFEEANDVVHVARKFPHTRFAIIDVSRHDMQGMGPLPRNVVSLVFKEQEIGYVAGYLAASMADLRRSPHIVSTIGAYSFVSSVERYIAGFQAGARKADRHIVLLNNYSQSFANAGVCRRLASAQIARGSSVVFPVAGGCSLGALEAARAQHVFGIGVDTDQSYLGPSVLTSALKRWDRQVFDTIKRFRDGTLPDGRNVEFGYGGGYLGLGPLSRRVPPSVAARVRAIAREVAAGRIRHIPAAPLVG